MGRPWACVHKPMKGAPTAWLKEKPVLPYLATGSPGHSWRPAASSSVTKTGMTWTFGGRTAPGITKQHRRPSLDQRRGE